MDEGSDSKTIDQIIVNYLRTLDNNSIVILKGFNNCLSHIQDKLVFSGNLLDSDPISALSVQSLMMQNDGTKFILYEDYLLMQNKQLSGLLGLSPNAYILNNDFYNLYYPSIADDEANEDIVKSLDQLKITSCKSYMAILKSRASITMSPIAIRMTMTPYQQ